MDEEENEVLSFEEFTARDDSTGLPRYNNIIGFFKQGDVLRCYREQWFFKRFKKEFPIIEQRAREGVEEAGNQLGALKPIERDLYEFYRIARRFGVSNQELFT